MQTVSDRFLAELHQPVFQIRVQLEVLDPDGTPVSGGTFFDTSYSNDATGILIDGAVDLDTTKAARRTFTATLLNNFGEWSPEADWSGIFYVDRLIRISRGFVYSDGVEELVPIGTFFIDHADMTVERNMSVVVLSGTDKWKKLQKSLFTRPYSWAAGSTVNSVIEDLLTGADITEYALDALVSRSTSQKTLNTKLMVDIKDSRADALVNLAKSFGIDMYFDPSGLFVTEEISSPADQPLVYTFTG